jgi:hypothetical protein
VKPTCTFHFCQATPCPLTVNDAPSGWVISIGLRSARGASKYGTLSVAAMPSGS